MTSFLVAVRLGHLLHKGKGMKDPGVRLLYPSLTGVHAWVSTSKAILIKKKK